MTKRQGFWLAPLCWLCFSTPAQASHSGWADASDVGRGILVAASLGVPAVQQDWEGDLQAGGSLLLAGGSSYAMKQIFPERRPDGNGDDSFPSGHTAVSFAAAATLSKRYGWKAGLPAFAVAGLVGVARVEARRHHWYDSVAGAALGAGSGFLLTSSRRSSRIAIVPWGDSRGGGATIAMRF